MVSPCPGEATEGEAAYCYALTLALAFAFELAFASASVVGPVREAFFAISVLVGSLEVVEFVQAAFEFVFLFVVVQHL